jgi:hypothetical protein
VALLRCPPDADTVTTTLFDDRPDGLVMRNVYSPRISSTRLALTVSGVTD